MPIGDVSPDGKWLWDGHAWVPTLSPDGAWRWNGTAWVAANAALPVVMATGGWLRGVPGFRTGSPWRMAVAAVGYLGMGGVALIAAIAIIGAATGGLNTNGNPVAAVTPSAPQVNASSPSAPALHSPSPVALRPSPSHAPSPKPSPRAKPSPAPKPPVVKSTCGAPANPWGYNFCGGQLIYSPASSFCSYFNCIPSFWNSTKGYVDECVDGTYSHSGGRSGACSYHHGELRPLYRP